MRARGDLQPFVQAQDAVWDTVCAELAAGAKRSHWMWFVFPQLASLGRSGTARFYGLADREEAQAYWRHPVLGPRLRQLTQALGALHGRSAHAVFGSPDDLKLRSCMTLFEQVAPEEPAFGAVIAQWYGGERDPLTLAALRAPG